MISRRTYVFSALALAAMLFVGIKSSPIPCFTTARLDLTQTGQFTLAAGTRNIIAKLPEPVTLKFYYSRRSRLGLCRRSPPMPSGCAICCGEYAALSHGKIILEEIDPEPFTPEEDEASARRPHRRAPTDGGDVVYFGLSAPTASTASRPSLSSRRSARLISNTTSPR